MVTIQTKEFGRTKNGEKVTAFKISNANNMSVNVLDFGGTVQSITVPDNKGMPTDVVLGYDDLESYEKGASFLGAIVGRCANRIKKGHFVIDGKEYNLEINNGENHNHGVFSKKIFDAQIDGDDLVLQYYSTDMEEGFPGNLKVEVRYRLRDDNALEILYKAETDAPTVVNLTNHSYFNLNGQDGSRVLEHKLQLNCGSYTEIDETIAQTGKIISTENTPLDFREEHTIGERIKDDYPQLRLCSGYDHNMIVDGKNGELRKVGTVKSDKTGISMDTFTTEPAIQLYSANFIHRDTVLYGKNGIDFPKNGGICLEAQHYPDSINHPNFPSTLLRPGEIYEQRTIYQFKTYNS